MFETCMASFRRQSDDTIIVFTDNIEQAYRDEMTKAYGIKWRTVPSMQGKRALAKIEILRDFVYECQDGDVILVGDIDLYFCSPPWPTFDDFAITERFYQYCKPINGGVFYIRVSDRIRKFMDWHVQWSFGAPSPYGHDWTVGQAFLCYIGAQPDVANAKYGVKVTVLGAEWNYCPGTDVFGKVGAMTRLLVAYKTGSANILHFKSELKAGIYSGWLHGAVTRHGKGVMDWQKAGA